MPENKEIICPNCGSRISFQEGTIVEVCIACKTRFQVPGAVKVAAKPEGTVVMVEPLSAPVVNKGGK